MKNCFPSAFCLATLLIALLVMPVRVLADESKDLFQEIDIGLGYAGQTATQVDNSSELNASLKYAASLQVSTDLLLLFGAEWRSFSFPPPRASAVPSSLQQVNTIVGFDYQLGEQWLMHTELQPGFYGDLSRFDGRRFNAPLMLGFVYLIDADLQWAFGLRVDVRSQYPVLPAVGVRWKFADLWTLNLMLPNPRLEYDVNDKLQVNLGAGIMAGTYVVGDHFGDDRGLPQLNNATVDYTEVRLGPGLSWKVLPNLTLEAELGYVLHRTWNFFDQDIEPGSKAVPFLQIACQARF